MEKLTPTELDLLFAALDALEKKGGEGALVGRLMKDLMLKDAPEEVRLRVEFEEQERARREAAERSKLRREVAVLRGKLVNLSQ